MKDDKNVSGEDAVREMRRLTRRSFLFGGAAALAGIGGVTWLKSRPLADGVPWPLRSALAFNERVGRALFSDRHLAPEFDSAYAAEPRVNGWIGWAENQPSVANWRVSVEMPGVPDRSFSLADLATVPRTGMITEHKCVEGWSQIVAWEGWRLADVLRTLRLMPAAPLPYVQMSTWDGQYTAALDLPSVLHPQTILCDRMNGEPLTIGHGAPLRLAIPVKYGIKNIKWLSRIRFQSERPTDYWTARGYDWYAGL